VAGACEHSNEALDFMRRSYQLRSVEVIMELDFMKDTALPQIMHGTGVKLVSF
jgi:hypothetical protein